MNIESIRKAYRLAAPFGRKRLIAVLFITLLQGIMQTVGVASIFPFLSLAADPSLARESRAGQFLAQFLPEMADRQLLILAGSAAIAMLVITNGTNLFVLYYTHRYSRGFGHWLRMKLLNKIVAQDYRYFLLNNTGILLKKINTDVRTYTTQVLLQMLLAIAGLVNVLLLSAMIFWLNPLAAAIAIGVFAAMYLLAFWGMARHRRDYSKTMKLVLRETNRQVQQLLGGIKPIKVQGVEPHFVSSLCEHSMRESKIQAKHNVILMAPKYIFEAVAFSALIAVLIGYIFAGKPLASILPAIGIIAFSAYRLMPNTQQIYNAFSTISANAYALAEVYEEIYSDDPVAEVSIPALPQVETLPFETEIRIDQLSFSYAQNMEPVLADFSLRIPKYDSVAFVGQSGCGKSTLIDLLLGLHAPSSGKILIDNAVLSDQNIQAWRSKIGYVPQDIFLLDASIKANIALGIASKEICDERLRRVCEAAQIIEFMENELPDGWNTKVGERGVRLSGGQRQRIGLARALYRNPEVLILDEATSALDNATEAGVMGAISSLYGSLTIIIVSHRLGTIQWCNQIIELHSSSHPSPV